MSADLDRAITGIYDFDLLGLFLGGEREIADSCRQCSVGLDVNAMTTAPLTSGVIIDGPRSPADRR
jgi:hypothetical protein